MITRSSLATSSIVAVSLMLAIPVASATTYLRPLLRPTIGSSSSSTSSSSSMSSVSSASLTLNSSSSMSSSSMSSSSSSSATIKSLKLPSSSKDKNLEEYCKAIGLLYAKGGNMTVDSKHAEHFNHTMDLLAKANALCGAMELNAVSSVSSSSSSVSSTWWSSSSSSSTGWKSPTAPSFSSCKNMGTEKTVGGVKFCKFICGLNVKVEPCPKS